MVLRHNCRLGTDRICSMSSEDEAGVSAVSLSCLALAAFAALELPAAAFACVFAFALAVFAIVPRTDNGVLDNSTLKMGTVERLRKNITSQRRRHPTEPSTACRNDILPCRFVQSKSKTSSSHAGLFAHVKRNEKHLGCSNDHWTSMPR